VFRVLFRRRRAFLLGAAAVAFAVLVASTYLPVEYAATARVELQPEPTAGEAAPGQGAAAGPADLVASIAGRAAVEKAADDLGLTRWLPPDATSDPSMPSPTVRQELVAGLMKSLRITREPRPGQADVIAITCTNRDPRLARELPNALVTNYVLAAEGQRLKRLGESRDALQKQVSDADARLAELTKRQIDFETRQGAAMPESPGAIHQRIQEVRAQLDSLRVQESAARQKVERLRQLATVAKPPEEPQEVIKGPNPVYKDIEDRLREAQAEYATATGVRNMREDHPTVQTLRKKIETLKKQLEEVPKETVIQKTYTSKATTGNDLTLQLATAQSEVDKAALETKRLEARLAEAQNDLVKFGPAREEYLALLKQADEQRAELRRRQDRLAEAQTSLAGEEARRGTALASVQLAEKPLHPSSPALWHVLGVALLGGLVAGAALALAAQAMDRTIATADEAARAFNLPVCGTISEIVSPRRRVWRAAKRWVLRPAVTLVILAAVGLAALGAVLRLNCPDQYERWREHPQAFLHEQLADWTHRLQPSP
jgi:uncharacterized protein involved in exopolysaccharide biosynthesis